MLLPRPLIWIACEFSRLLGRVIDQGGISGGQNLACILPSAHPPSSGMPPAPLVCWLVQEEHPQPPCLRLPLLWPVFTSHLYSLPPWPWPPFLSLSRAVLPLCHSQSDGWFNFLSLRALFFLAWPGTGQTPKVLRQVAQESGVLAGEARGSHTGLEGSKPLSFASFPSPSPWSDLAELQPSPTHI